MRMGAGYPRQTTTCLPIFYSLQTERATRKRRPLFHLQTRGLMLPARCWKRSLQHSTCSGDANGSGFPTANSYLLPIFSFLRVKRATRQRRPLLQHVKQQLRLPAHCWKRSLQVSYSHVALRKRLHFRRQSSSWLLSDRFLPAQMPGEQRRHLVRRLALTTRCCKRPFVVPFVRRVSYTWEYSPSPAGDRPIMASS